MVAPETLAVGVYAVFLLACAAGLDRLARHTHRRAERYRTGGFVFHEHLDAWECPEGEHLPRVQTDHELRLVRYRARARVCNACAVRAACTDSADGREIARAMDPWPHSEAGRFHRGIALVLCALATVLPLAELARHHGVTEAALMVAALALALLEGVHFGAVFLATPANAPGDETAAALW